MKGALLLPLAAAGSLSGCTTFMRGALVGWNCNSETAPGDIQGSGYYYLDPSGKPTANGSDWKWAANDRDFQIYMKKSDFGEDLEFAANMPPLVTMELRFDRIDKPQTDSSLMGRVSIPRQAWVHLSRTTWDQLSSSRRPLFVVGLDPEGRVIRAIPVDPTVLERGEKTKELARREVAEKARNFRQSCRPIYEGDQGIVIT